MTPGSATLGRLTDGYRPLRPAGAHTTPNLPHSQRYPTGVKSSTHVSDPVIPANIWVLPLPGIHQTSSTPSPVLTDARLHHPHPCHATAESGVGGLPCPETAGPGTARASPPPHAAPLHFRAASSLNAALAQGADITRFFQIHMTTLTTGIFPMLCIGQMERFQPFHQGKMPARMAHNGERTGTRRRRLGFPSCPSCGIHDRTLGPAADKSGAMVVGGRPRSQCRRWPPHCRRQVHFRAAQNTTNANTETLGIVRHCKVSTLCEPQKSSLFCT